MRSILLVTVATFGLLTASAAMADEFGGRSYQYDQQDQGNVSAYMDQQATGAQLSDPTAPNSIRSHGRP